MNKSFKKIMMHFKSRSIAYPRSEIKRFLVPDERVSWETPWEDYRPVRYTSESVMNKPWSDPEVFSVDPKWHSLDNGVDRRSFAAYKLKDGVPLNPIGRTGLCGRGVLGRWGPNHAADPIVTRWKEENGETVKINEKPVLQFVAIKRGDSGETAIPGGMVDAGELVTETLKREFFEEALNSLEMDSNFKMEIESKLKKLFTSGVEVYSGYVDDPRNTDNAWIETAAYNFHDSHRSTAQLHLTAGDDAVGVSWLDISKNLKLYASHYDLIEIVAKMHNSHW